MCVVFSGQGPTSGEGVRAVLQAPQTSAVPAPGECPAEVRPLRRVEGGNPFPAVGHRNRLGASVSDTCVVKPSGRPARVFDGNPKRPPKRIKGKKQPFSDGLKRSRRHLRIWT